MCCEADYLKDIPLIYDYAAIACLPGPEPGETTLTVTLIPPASPVSIKWYMWNGSTWIDTTETGLSIVVTVDGKYLALIISSEGSITLEIKSPCGIVSPQPWIDPDGDPWVDPGGDSWIWVF